MLADSSFSALVDVIYDAAANQSRWPDAMARIAAATRSMASMMYIYDVADRRLEMLPVGFDPGAAQAYTDRYSRIDPLIPTVLGLPLGAAITDRAVMPKAQMSRTRIFNEWVAPNGIDGAACVLFQRDESFLATLAVARPPGAEEFDGPELNLLSQLAPHLRRAVQLNVRLAGLELTTTAENLLNRLDHGMLLVDAAARVLFANRAAEEMLAARRGLSVRAGVLHAERLPESNALHGLIGACRPNARDAGSGGHLTLSPPDGRPALSLLIVPVSSDLSFHLSRAPVAVVAIADPANVPVPRAALLQERFGLTRAEAAVAMEMIEGDGLRAIADRLRVSLATIRTHRTSIFEKVGVRRQAELGIPPPKAVWMTGQ